MMWHAVAAFDEAGVNAVGGWRLSSLSRVTVIVLVEIASRCAPTPPAVALSSEVLCFPGECPTPPTASLLGDAGGYGDPVGVKTDDASVRGSEGG